MDKRPEMHNHDNKRTDAIGLGFLIGRESICIRTRRQGNKRVNVKAKRCQDVKLPKDNDGAKTGDKLMIFS